MARYFKTVEIDEEEFTQETGETLGWCTVLTAPEGGAVYAAVDDELEEEFNIPLWQFDETS